MADQNKKKYIEYEDTRYELVDGEARDRISALEQIDGSAELERVENNLVAFAASVEQALGAGVTPLAFRSGYYRTESPSSGRVVTYNKSANYVCAICPVSKGDTVVINASGSSGVYRLYDIINSAGKTIRYASANAKGPVTVKIVDDSAAAIVINNYLPYQPEDYYACRGTNVAGQIAALQSALTAGTVTYAAIEGFGTDGCFTESFSLTVPYNGDSRNQIFTCAAGYTRTGSVPPPTVQFALGSGLNCSTVYELGGEGFPTVKQWRVVRDPGDTTDLTVRFTIPSGCSVQITEFRNAYSDQICRVTSGIRIHAHRRMPTTPYDSLQSAILAAKTGYGAMVQVPKRTSDGVWLCYHDDSLDVSDTYLRQADGTNLPAAYNGKTWSEISSAEAESWDWGISKHARFAGTKPMRLEQFFTLCAKTGMRPILSVHPLPSGSELQEIKAMAKTCGVLSVLGVKGAVSFIPTLFQAFGNEVESYTCDVASGEQPQSVIQSAISTMNGLQGCTARKVIELFKSTAYAAYFGASPYDAYEQIAAAGIGCALTQQTAVGSPSGYTGKLAYLCGADMEWWAAKHGVTEFTDEYNWSTGLNW